MRKAWSFILLWGAVLGLLPARGAELETRFVRMDKSAFGPNSLEPGARDVSGKLRERGLQLPEGSQAWFDANSGMLMIRSIPEDLQKAALMRRVIPGGADKLIEVSAVAVAWRPRDPVASALAGPITHEALVKLDRTELQVVARQSILTKSGARARVENKGEDVVPEAYRGPVAEWWESDGPERRVEMEVDPFLNPDWNSVSMNFSWNFTAPDRKRPDRRIYQYLGTALDLTSGQPEVLEVGTLEGGDVMVLLVVEVTIKSGGQEP